VYENGEAESDKAVVEEVNDVCLEGGVGVPRLFSWEEE